MKIDNEMYFREDIRWWDDSYDSHGAFLRYIVNPIRFSFIKRIIKSNFSGSFAGMKMLDVGCGGGFLSEELAKIGISVTGMDPSPVGLKEAREHASKNSLNIAYIEGYGEKIPLDDNSFDGVACCDVLEHVDDLDKVIGEIARVLKPGGLFFYDTVNRTLASYLIVIKVAQDWKFTAWEQPRLHVWDKFIKPAELTAIMKKHDLVNKETKGISSDNGIVPDFLKIRKRARGEISRYEMGIGLKLHECDNTSVQYMGYAVKQ